MSSSDDPFSVAWRLILVVVLSGSIDEAGVIRPLVALVIGILCVGIAKRTANRTPPEPAEPRVEQFGQGPDQ